MTEPAIIINGKELTKAQAMTLRVAVSNFLIEMLETGALGDDQHGYAMQIAYQANLRAIMEIMLNG